MTRTSTPSPLPDPLHIHIIPADTATPIDLAAVVEWLPVIGPTGAWLTLLTATWATDHQIHSYDPAILACHLGVARAQLARTFERLHQFRLGTWRSPDTFVFTAPLPHVPRSLMLRVTERALATPTTPTTPSCGPDADASAAA